MKSELTAIYNQKQEDRKKLKELKNRYAAIIYAGAARGETMAEIRKKLKNETIKSPVKSENAYKAAIAGALAVSRRENAERDREFEQTEAKYGDTVGKGALAAVLAYDLISRVGVPEMIAKGITEDLGGWEERQKEDLLATSIEDNSRQKMIFYLASRHDDCAEDHEDYQGKVYVDEKWRDAIKSPEAVTEVERYIKRNRVMTIQEVTDPPVRLITRANCRHYFKALAVGEVIAGDKDELVKKYNMTEKIGKRGVLQTARHGKIKGKDDALEMAKMYEERLAMHKEMYRELPSEVLKNAMNKDRMLINKWKKYANASLQ